MPWFWDPVTMSSQIPLCLPICPTCSHSTIKSDSTQESVKPKSTRLAPGASAIKEQGFSEAVAARIEAPQTGSTKVDLLYKVVPQ